jgi:hypothetical protein
MVWNREVGYKRIRVADEKPNLATISIIDRILGIGLFPARGVIPVKIYDAGIREEEDMKR